ncbi:Bacterial extracellular solute-binding protein, family 3 [Methyloligella halotolerans]|uniref:Bacterial extracellular solute-binding protein, family 3 n=1 Tax=Methyloligella halotolerans TaxID=1177755 RepID=A0A1E2S1D4_9HYPH|nr:quinoprotein dehydrogenase-associated putative ABC transporter substrate-binding protein [Methyloligella halotolerans]ODA68232.1 Bacterial extracellular solute-binding protein, family 3 [Methyloligella halotolerans]
MFGRPGNVGYRLAIGFAVLLLAGPCGLAGAQEAHAQPSETENEGPLRVCADPDNMPFSNEAGHGFENKLAELVADRLDRRLAYSWYPEARGGMPTPFSNRDCAIVMGYAQGAELIEDTNPYYYTSYVLLHRRDDEGMAGVKRLSDPRLKGKRIGIVARTPPAALLATNGLTASAVPYESSSEQDAPRPALDMIQALAEGELDAAILWGPIGGYFAQNSHVPIDVVPLVNETAGPALVYGITMGVPPNDPQWKHQLNKVIAENQDEINAILLSYNVPLLAPDGELIKSAER